MRNKYLKVDTDNLHMWVVELPLAYINARYAFSF